MKSCQRRPPRPATTGSTRRPVRWAAWLIALCLVYAPFGGSVPAATGAAQEAPPAPPPATPADDPDAAPAAAVPAPPPVTADATYVLDISANRPLYAQSPDERLAPASLTKIASALVVVRNVEDLAQEVEILPADLPEDPSESRVGFEAGDVYSVEQLLYGMLLPSGNDAARAAARVVGAGLLGEDVSQASRGLPAFVDAMNALVADLGLENTQFRNPVGLDEEGHYSSARDLALLAKELLQDEVLREIVRTPRYAFQSAAPGAEGFERENTNQLLFSGEDILGVKTGTTELAGGCLVAATRFAGRNRVVVVVLGSDVAYDSESILVTDARYDDARAILAAAAEDYRWIAPATPGELPELDAAMAAWGVAMKRGASLVVPSDRVEDLTFRLRLGPPGEPGAEVGRVLFFIGSELVGERAVFQAPLPEE